MKGFRVIDSERTLLVGVDNGGTSVILSNKEGEYSIYVGGIDDDGVFYTWLSRKLTINESIEVIYEEINPTSVSKVESVRDVRDEALENRMLLDAYYRMRKELLDEGYNLDI